MFPARITTSLLSFSDRNRVRSIIPFIRPPARTQSRSIPDRALVPETDKTENRSIRLPGILR